MFILIGLNFRDGILTFGLKQEYLQALPVFWIIGLTRIIDMGTGINTQIIGTSVYWRFDLFTGLVLVLFTIPLNYLLAKRVGITGPAIADLITFSLYNGIRFIFLYRRFGMQPFGYLPYMLCCSADLPMPAVTGFLGIVRVWSGFSPGRSLSLWFMSPG